jgi:enamine deaminase RidA (YjgF/YER057c/UK114 family)
MYGRHVLHTIAPGMIAALEPEARLAKLGLALPPTPEPTGSFLTAVGHGDLVFVAGHACWENGRFIAGRLGEDMDVEDGRRAARLAVLCCLSTLKAQLGQLSRVHRFLKLLGMVRATPDFAGVTPVIDGGSDLLIELFGDRGRHARSAVGMSTLPSRCAVEIEMVVAIQPPTPDP